MVPPGDADEIRKRLDRGILPRHYRSVMYAGYGRGEPCSACDGSISSDQVLYEFDTPDGHVVRLHLECARLWEAECRRHGWPEAR